MRTRFSNVLAAGFLLAFAFAAFGQTARTDAIWARRVVEGNTAKTPAIPAVAGAMKAGPYPPTRWMRP
ncbi:hypothetical protein HUU39_11380 [candidate division KSB1 bacterium]|nr:hypothetical protein [candidate division KSB1 bacterium]